MSDHIETPVQGKEALMYYFVDTPNGTLDKVIPADMREKFRAYISPGMSPVDACVHCSELIYARADELPVELVAIGANCAAMCAQYGFHDMANRGNAIAFHLRKIPGVVKPKTPPSEMKKPVPKDLYVAPEEPVSPPPTPPSA